MAQAIAQARPVPRRPGPAAADLGRPRRERRRAIASAVLGALPLAWAVPLLAGLLQPGGEPAIRILADTWRVMVPASPLLAAAAFALAEPWRKRVAAPDRANSRLAVLGRACAVATLALLVAALGLVLLFAASIPAD